MSVKIEQELDRYFLPRTVLAQSPKSNGKIYRTYCACLKKEYWTNNQPCYATIKEISTSQAETYYKLLTIRHPNLEKVFAVLPDDACYYAISEYISHPFRIGSSASAGIFYEDTSLTLQNFVQNYHCNLSGQPLSYSERTHQAFLILLQLCNALEELHLHGLIHGDIHPGNILLTDVPDGYKHPPEAIADFCIKLIDFDNTAVPKDNDHTVTRLMGSKPFTAPEILDFTHPLDKADIYSLGCILYYIICGESPKNYAPNKEVLQNKWVNRIFRRCTASYEARYRTVSALKKDILHALQIPSNPFTAILYNLPGFRTRTLWKMCVAAYIYSGILITAGIMLLLIIQNGFPLDDIVKDTLLSLILYILEIIVLFDGFQLEHRISRYAYFKSTHPILNIFFKFIIGALLFIPYSLLLSQ